jgi:hypothetical protein
MKKIVSILILNLFLVLHLHGADLDLSKVGDNNEEATKLLYRMAEDIGCNVSSYDGKLFILAQAGTRISICVKANETDPDRIIGYVGYRGKKENMNLEKFSSLANRVNKKYNMCTVTYDNDGGFTFRYNISFDNRLTPRLFKGWVDSIVESANYILTNEKELAEAL